jgi:hypothetical protein
MKKTTLHDISNQIAELGNDLRCEVRELREQVSEQIQDVLDLVDKRFLAIEEKVDRLIENTSNHETRISTLETGHSALRTQVTKLSRNR